MGTTTSRDETSCITPKASYYVRLVLELTKRVLNTRRVNSRVTDENKIFELIKVSSVKSKIMFCWKTLVNSLFAYKVNEMAAYCSSWLAKD